MTGNQAIAGNRARPRLTGDFPGRTEREMPSKISVNTGGLGRQTADLAGSGTKYCQADLLLSCSRPTERLEITA